MSFLTNAVLTAIEAPGAPDAYGDPTSTGTAVWAGRASAYLKRSRRSLVSGGQQMVVRTDILYVLDVDSPSNALAAAGASWEACTITIQDLRTGTPVARRFQVSAAEHRAAGTTVDSARLELVAEAATS